MTIELSTEDKFAVLRVEGRIWEEEDSAQLNEMIENVISGDYSYVIIDLANVPIMNSSGLGSLIAALKTIRARSGELVLAGINERLAQLFQITRLDTVFKTYDDVETAMDKVHSS